MTQVVLATRNAGKVVELRRILGQFAPRVELLSLADVAAYDEPAETGDSFTANALLKARACIAATSLPAVADDSGLVVDALHGMPGVLSARWSGRHHNDAANVRLVLDQLADVPDERRGGGFTCAAAFVDGQGREHVTEATWRGTVGREPRGHQGFGYDPIFIPNGLQRTCAQLDPEEKDARSHRGQAFRALARWLAAQ